MATIQPALPYLDKELETNIGSKELFCTLTSGVQQELVNSFRFNFKNVPMPTKLITMARDSEVGCTLDSLRRTRRGGKTRIEVVRRQAATSTGCSRHDEVRGLRSPPAVGRTIVQVVTPTTQQSTMRSMTQLTAQVFTTLGTHWAHQMTPTLQKPPDTASIVHPFGKQQAIGK
jgi:hypothetical protein